MKCGDTGHRQGFPCPASHFQCKNCNRIGHFTLRCLTKSKTINQIDFQEKSTPWMPGKPKPKVMQTPSTSTRYKSNNRHSRRTPKGSASTCMLTCHSQPGTATKNKLTFMPVSTQVQMWILRLCQCTSASLGTKISQHWGPVQCTMTVYTNNTIQNLRHTLVYVKYPGKHTQKLIFNVTNQEGSVVKVFSLNRIISLAERQAFAHCCELLQVWEKMFSLQYRKAKTVWENVYIYNFNIVWNLYWQMLCQFYLPNLYYDMSLCYVSDTKHMNIEADVIAFDCMADVIAM